CPPAEACLHPICAQTGAFGGALSLARLFAPELIAALQAGWPLAGAPCRLQTAGFSTGLLNSHPPLSSACENQINRAAGYPAQDSRKLTKQLTPVNRIRDKEIGAIGTNT